MIQQFCRRAGVGRPFVPRNWSVSWPRAMVPMGRRPTSSVPYLEDQLLQKMQDQRINQYGLRILKEKINLYKPLSVINTSYIINNDMVYKHRTTPAELESACAYINETDDFVLLSSDTVLERLFALLYLSLHTFKQSDIAHHEKVLSYIDSATKVYHFNILDRRIPQALNMQAETNMVLNNYYLGLENDNSNLLTGSHNFVERVIYLMMALFDKERLHYSICDINNWMSAINSSSIRKSHAWIAGPEVPRFVIGDFLLRQPRSAEDVELLLETAYSQPEVLFNDYALTEISPLFENMLHGCISFDTKLLKPLIDELLTTQASQLAGNDKIVLCNKVIMALSETNVRSPRDENFHKDLLHSQIQILTHLADEFPQEKPGDLITIEGYIGITSLFELMGDEKSLGVLSLLENEFHKTLSRLINGEESINLSSGVKRKRYISNSELLELESKMITLKLLLADNVNSLTREFDIVYTKEVGRLLLVKYPKIWTSFVLCLKKLGALNDELSRKIWRLYRETVLDKFDDTKNVSIDAKFVVELINSLSDTMYAMHILKVLQSKKYSLNNVILVKWFSKLYRSLARGDFQNVRNYNSLLDYTRSLYKNTRRKSPAVTSTVLLGEANIEPSLVYPMYRSELMGKKKDANALKALFIAALNHYREGEFDVKWFYEGREWRRCNEVCVAEFHAVRAKSSNDHRGVFPGRELWQLYIDVLSCYDMKSDLISAFYVLEELDQVPSEHLILTILANIDANDAMRILRHANRYMQTQELPYEVTSPEAVARHENQVSYGRHWPWPSEQVFSNFKYDYDAKKKEFKTRTLAAAEANLAATTG